MKGLKVYIWDFSWNQNFLFSNFLTRWSVGLWGLLWPFSLPLAALWPLNAYWLRMRDRGKSRGSAKPANYPNLNTRSCFQPLPFNNLSESSIPSPNTQLSQLYNTQPPLVTQYPCHLVSNVHRMLMTTSNLHCIDLFKG